MTIAPATADKLARLERLFAGSLLGTFCGDALGMPAEGLSLADLRARFGVLRDLADGRLPRGSFTDDTQMTVAVAESLLRARKFDGLDLARTFAAGYEEKRGYGAGTRAAIEMLRAGVPWDEAGPRVHVGGSFGNGAAMRVAPVGLLYHEDPERCGQAARDTARVTHSHELGMEGANLQAQAVAMAVRLAGRSFSPVGFLKAISDHVKMHGGPFRGKLTVAERLLETGATPEQAIADLGHGVAAIDSVPTAIYAFARHPHSFEEAVVFAVNLGGDTDTLGAMAGAIAGAYHGEGAIPARWLGVLEGGTKGRDAVRSLARRLAAFACGLPEGEPEKMH
jgi:poly(ADP-ribose) glycohydrolase ARH3